MNAKNHLRANPVNHNLTVDGKTVETKRMVKGN
jgi:hypothetical protein